MGGEARHSRAVGAATIALVAAAAGMVLARPSAPEVSRPISIPKSRDSKLVAPPSDESANPVHPAPEPATDTPVSDSDKKAPVQGSYFETAPLVEPLLRKQLGMVEYLVYPHEIVCRFKSQETGPVRIIGLEFHIAPFEEAVPFFAAMFEEYNAILVLAARWEGFIQMMEVGVFSFADGTYSTYRLGLEETWALRRALGSGVPFTRYEVAGWVSCLSPNKSAPFSLWLRLVGDLKDPKLRVSLQPLPTSIFTQRYGVSVESDKLVIEGSEEKLVLKPPKK